MLAKIQGMINNKDRQPVGEKYLLHIEKQLARLKSRKKRPVKPAPRGRAALVARQKKARPQV